MFLLFDCETTGLPHRRNLSPWDVSGWPRLVQLAWEFYDSLGNPEDMHCQIIRPDGFEIPAEATRIHGISHSRILLSLYKKESIGSGQSRSPQAGFEAAGVIFPLQGAIARRV